jgi:hypothetical protein
MDIGATLGIQFDTGAYTARTVVDVNAVLAYGGAKVINGHRMILAPTFIGFLYLDNQGGLWFQKDPSLSPNFSLSAGQTINGWTVSFGFSQSLGTDAAYIGMKPTEMPHTTSIKCFTGGRGFYPDTIG